jgi:hypothetical protein
MTFFLIKAMKIAQGKRGLHTGKDTGIRMPPQQNCRITFGEIKIFIFSRGNLQLADCAN